MIFYTIFLVKQPYYSCGVCVFEESDPLSAFLLPSIVGPCVVVACPLIEPVVSPVLVNIFLLCFGREQSFKKTECCGKI